MAKLKIKKVLLKRDEHEMLMEFARGMDICFQIRENEGVILENLSEGVELKFKYTIHFEGLEDIEVRLDKEATSFVKAIEYIIENEMEKKSLAAEILDNYKEINIFYNMSERIAFISDIEMTAQGAFEEARKYITASYSLLLLFDEMKEKLTRVFEYKGGHPSQKVNIGSALIRSIMEEGTSDLIQDISASNYKGSCSKIKSMIYVPIIIKNYIYGVFIMGNHEKIEYSSGDLKLAAAIAFLLGVSIENSKLYSSLQDTFFQTVKALSETIEKRDSYTGGHVQRVMEYSIVIGKSMGLSKEELDKLKLAALMHDIGKIGIEDNILRKSYLLSDEEYWVMKKHTVYGAEIIQNIKELRGIIPGVRGHHERFDGRGYPDGLEGEDIALLGRIIAVADTFDAMITDRPYRKALTTVEAVKELEKNSGKQFDPEVVNAFIKALKSRKSI